jgi:hypothetical protein
VSAHYLIVGEYGDEDLFDVEHPETCPDVVIYEGDDEHPDVTDKNCMVGWLIRQSGIEGFFQHADDPAPDGYDQVRVSAGRHAIAPWETRHYSHYYGSHEWNAGLDLAENGGDQT